MGNAALNNKLLKCDIPSDRAKWDSVPQIPFVPIRDTVMGFVRTAAKGGETKDIPLGYLVHMLKALGLDWKGNMTDEASIEKLELGIKMLLDIYFVKKDALQRAEVIAKLIFFNKKLVKRHATKLDSMSPDLSRVPQVLEVLPGC